MDALVRFLIAMFFLQSDSPKSFGPQTTSDLLPNVPFTWTYERKGQALFVRGRKDDGSYIHHWCLVPLEDGTLQVSYNYTGPEGASVKTPVGFPGGSKTVFERFLTVIAHEGADKHDPKESRMILKMASLDPKTQDWASNIAAYLGIDLSGGMTTGV